MKSKELYYALGEYLKANPSLEDIEIEIVTSDPSIGPVSAVTCAAIYPGFDWDAGRLLIDTKEGVWKESEMKKRLMKKKCYKIISCTDHEGKEKPGYRHRVGRIVSEPIVDNVRNYAWMNYFYDNKGQEMRFGQILKTSKISEIRRKFNNELETIVIKSENTIYNLEEISL